LAKRFLGALAGVWLAGSGGVRDLEERAATHTNVREQFSALLLDVLRIRLQLAHPRFRLLA